MGNFKTYVLSLRKDIERREHMMFMTPILDIEFYDAVEPEDITKEIEGLFKQTDFHEWDINVKSVIATFISHLNLLKLSVEKKENLLILEDDIEMVRPFDFNNINFKTFDLYSLGTHFGCYSYFVTPQGSEKILKHFNETTITQAYDWELSKIKHLNFKFVESPIFVQVENKFPSNIAPNGYKRR